MDPPCWDTACCGIRGDSVIVGVVCMARVLSVMEMGGFLFIQRTWYRGTEHDACVSYCNYGCD